VLVEAGVEVGVEAEVGNRWYTGCGVRWKRGSGARSNTVEDHLPVAGDQT